MTYKKKLIEVALPLEAINAACAQDKDRKTGHIRNLHKWFAPMPLPAWRAVLFASIVDDPSTNLPPQDAERERQRLFELLERILPHESIHDMASLAAVRAEMLKATPSGDLPLILDPFCGGGSTIVEAQRLGFPTMAADLNPIPVLITKMLCEYPPLLRNLPPVNPESQRQRLFPREGLQGFVEDVRYYARIVSERASKLIGHLFPPAANGEQALAWRWAKTVRSPNPAVRGAYTPLVSDWWLSKRTKDHAWIEPVVDASRNSVTFRVATRGEPPPRTIGKGGGRCIVSGTAIPLTYIREQGRAGQLRDTLLATVTDGDHGKMYLPPDRVQEEAAARANPKEAPELRIPDRALGFRVQEYGVHTYADLFTRRQCVVLETFSDLVGHIFDEIVADARRADLSASPAGDTDAQCSAETYARAVTTFLGLCVGKLAQSNSTLVRWYIDARNGSGKATPAFDRHAVPMIWDFVETNPFGNSVGGWLGPVVSTALRSLEVVAPGGSRSIVLNADARTVPITESARPLVATDPPYYKNIGYADLSDFFYIWIRKSLSKHHGGLLSTLGTPKVNELIANPFRHDGDAAKASEYFREGFTQVFSRLGAAARSEYPMSIVYAFMEHEEEAEGGSVSTGWDVMLEGLIDSNLMVTGTWPIRTTRKARMIGIGTNSLASAIVVVCRPRPMGAPVSTRKEFLAALKRELPDALRKLQHGNIAPVDLAQAAIGPGMAVFSRYAKVLEADGGAMTVRTALALINQALDEVLAEQDSDLDADTRWALAWFEQHGFGEAAFGDAETLSKAKNTSLRGLEDAGILRSKAGKVRLLKREELDAAWDPATDPRLTVWEIVHHLSRALETGGEAGAAAILRKLGPRAEAARELAYRLYTLCERKKRAEEARAYNALVVAWPRIAEAVQTLPPPKQGEMF